MRKVFRPVVVATAMTPALWLNAMHVVAGALIIPMVALALPTGEGSTTPQ